MTIITIDQENRIDGFPFSFLWTNEKEINCIDLMEISPIECHIEQWSPAEQSWNKSILMSNPKYSARKMIRWAIMLDWKIEKKLYSCSFTWKQTYQLHHAMIWSWSLLLHRSRHEVHYIEEVPGVAREIRLFHVSFHWKTAGFSFSITHLFSSIEPIHLIQVKRRSSIYQLFNFSSTFCRFPFILTGLGLCLLFVFLSVPIRHSIIILSGCTQSPVPLLCLPPRRVLPLSPLKCFSRFPFSKYQ